jgi:predicted transcriptional regulator
MPDGRSYFWIARTVARKRTGYGKPTKTFAIGLGCELRHAHRLVYSHGLDLDDKTLATPIGMGCKICERSNCPQRAFPQVDRPLDINEHRSTFAPYPVQAS